MSLTLTQQPSGIVSANNDVYWGVSSSTPFMVSASNYTQYKVTADLYISGSYQTTLKSYPDSLGFFYFNTRNVANNFVSFDFLHKLSDSTGSVFHSASNSYAPNCYFNFGEEYFFSSSISSSTFIQNKGLTTSSAVTFVNSSLTFLDQVNLNLNNYRVTNNTSSLGNFLTSANFAIPAYTNLRSYLYFYLSQSLATSTYLSIITSDVNGNQLGSYFIPSFLTTGTPQIQIVDTGYPQLASYTSGSITPSMGQYAVLSGNPIMFNNSVASYKVQIIGNASIPFSNTVSYQIITDCNRFAPYAYQLYWLNEFGGFDSWNFARLNQTTEKKTVAEYTKIYGKGNSSGQYIINTYDHNRRPYFTSAQQSIVINSDFLTDQQILYLKELFNSPVVYAIDYSGNMFACTVQIDSYEIKRKINTKANSLTLTIVPSFDDFRQSF